MTIVLPHYKTQEIIYRGRNSIVLKALIEKTNTSVVIKLLNYEYPAPSQIAQFEHEYALTEAIYKKLGENAIKPLEFAKYQNTYAIVLEDFGGVSLAKFLKAGPLDITQFLNLAIKLAHIIGQIHSQKILIKDINPSNILWNPQTDQIKIIDFGLSTTLSFENLAMSNANNINGTLAYISPEQTGRMNRVVDYRSDYYSLGVTFYEMLVGETPFKSQDSMELVHAHMAKIPLAPEKLNPEIPADLSNVILKLLQKTPEKRYQSSYGIISDLQEAERQWLTFHEIHLPILGKNDISTKFQLSEKLYGREEETAALLQSYSEVCKGQAELIFVSGIPGVGKSALIHEINKPIAKKRGFFIFGKFDQIKHNVPFEPFVNAFRNLIIQILTESPEKILQWKRTIQNAVGINGKLVVDVIPEVRNIIGEQPDIPETGLAEMKNRFAYVFQNFIQAFASEEHPLTLFLDDLQWADLSSLELMERLFLDNKTHHLQLIGAYRSNEVDSSHLLKITLDNLTTHQIAYKKIHLSTLSIDSVIEFIADTLKTHPQKVKSLGHLCYSKTQGNPFFLNQLLLSLHEKNLVSFDFKTGTWQWDIKKIKAINISDNVVEFMSKKLLELPENTQAILRYAACLGNNFKLNDLSLVAKKSIEETSQDLWQAMQEGLIIPESENYKFIKDNLEISIPYRFLHDRVQQAAHALIPLSQIDYYHFHIGQTLFKNTPTEKIKDHVFQIVNHLNRGIGFITTSEEKNQIIHLNLLASEKSKSSSAFKTSVDYLKTAISFLDTDSWDNNYELTFHLFKEYSANLFIVGEHEIAKNIVQEILKNAKTPFEKSQILSMQVSLYRTIGKIEEAIVAGIEGLKLLGIEVPRFPSKLTLLKEYLLTRWNLGRRAPSSLINMPSLSDPKIELISAIIHETNMAGYYTGNPNLTGLLILKKVNLSLTLGNYPGASIGYLGYAMILTTMGKLKEAYEFSKLALDLCRTFHDDALKARIYTTYAMLIHGWNFHWKTLPSYFEEAIKAGLESGDLMTATSGASSLLLWDPTLSLDDFVKESEKQLDFIRLSRNQNALDSTQLEFQFRFNLAGKTRDPLSLSDKNFDEEACLKRLENAKFSSGLALFYKCKSMVYYYQGDFLNSLKYSLKAAEFIGGLFGSLFYVENTLYHFYINAAAYPLLSRVEQKLAWKRMKKVLKAVTQWANHCPENFLHHRYLMEAELNRINHRNFQASILYDQAIEAAKNQDFTRYEALANELAGAFYLATDKEKIAKKYFQEARYAYEKWGAIEKVKQLEKAFPELSPKNVQNTLIATKHTDSENSSSSTSQHLDFISITKASQALSREVHLPKLIKKMMHVVLENAGAEKGTLLLEQEGEFVIEAIMQGDTLENIDKKSPLESLVPYAIIETVKMTKQPVILDNASQSEEYQLDPYIRKIQPKSILCLPLLNIDTLTGILYLENNLTEKVFNEENLNILLTLSAQMAISINNALFYSQLENKIKERTKALVYAQNRLVRKEKMAFLGMLSTGIAHEIKNPLNFIINFTENSNQILNDIDYYGTINHLDSYKELMTYLHMLKNYSNLIAEEGKKADDIVNRMIEHASFKIPEQTLCNMEELIQNCFIRAQELFLKKYPDFDVLFEKKFETSTKYLQVSIVDFQRVLINLFDNAFYTIYQKSKKEEGYKPKVLVKTEETLDSFSIIITDNGEGIPLDLQNKIFTPFFTTKLSGEGVGLGLALCRNIIEEEHGGSISFTTKLYNGTTFSIRLPYKKEGGI